MSIEFSDIQIARIRDVFKLQISKSMSDREFTRAHIDREIYKKVEDEGKKIGTFPNMDTFFDKKESEDIEP